MHIGAKPDMLHMTYNVATYAHSCFSIMFSSLTKTVVIGGCLATLGYSLWKNYCNENLHHAKEAETQTLMAYVEDSESQTPSVDIKESESQTTSVDNKQAETPTSRADIKEAESQTFNANIKEAESQTSTFNTQEAASQTHPVNIKEVVTQTNKSCTKDTVSQTSAIYTEEVAAQTIAIDTQLQENISLCYSLTQCSYCQCLGHKSNTCSVVQKGLPPTCRNCAMLHSTSACNSKISRCAICFWNGEKYFSHETQDSCPIMRDEIVTMLM